MRAPIVVLAVGNRSRGDDALGPLLLERLASWLDAERRCGEFELIDDFQLQIEHALDLGDRRLALFIDAGTCTPAPYAFYAAGPAGAMATHSSHALPPEAVLAVYRTLAGSEPPPAFVLCVRGEQFGLGDGLSSAAASNLEAAWQHLCMLCRRPDAVAWRHAATRTDEPPASKRGAVRLGANARPDPTLWNQPAPQATLNRSTIALPVDAWLASGVGLPPTT
jgi:hydrogenase maturation protease